MSASSWNLWLRGCDGSLWDLRRGPVQIKRGFALRGLLRAPREVGLDEVSNRDGAQPTGSRVPATFPRLPVIVNGAKSPAEWERLYDAWSAAFDEIESSELIYQKESGELLTLTTHLLRAPEETDYDVVAAQRFIGTWELIARDPFWYHEMVSLTFESASAAPVNYYGGEGGAGGYPLVRSAGRQSGRAPLANPGTEPVHWMARFPSPSAGFEVEVDGHRVAGTMAIPDGAVLEIDSSLSAFWLRRAGVAELVPYSAGVTAADFALLRSGVGSTVQLVNQGAGSPTLTYKPKRREAL